MAPGWYASRTTQLLKGGGGRGLEKAALCRREREPSERTVSGGANELEKYFLIDLNPARALPPGLVVGSHPLTRRRSPLCSGITRRDGKLCEFPQITD